MSDVLSDDAGRLLGLARADPGPLLREMAEHGRERSFPIVGPDAGGFLRVLARLVDAERVFEFGSGFGYSAAWFAGALPDDGELVLTDYDEDDLAEAREFLARADYDGAVRYEAGDAMETFERYDGPFDVVLIDHSKRQYVDAFEAARADLADGGVVVADNVMRGPADIRDVIDVLDGADPVEEMAAGIADYVAHVRDDPGFDTTVVPLGSGLAVSTPR